MRARKGKMNNLKDWLPLAAFLVICLSVWRFNVLKRERNHWAMRANYWESNYKALRVEIEQRFTGSVIDKAMFTNGSPAEAVTIGKNYSLCPTCKKYWPSDAGHICDPLSPSKTDCATPVDATDPSDSIQGG